MPLKSEWLLALVLLWDCLIPSATYLHAPSSVPLAGFLTPPMHPSFVFPLSPSYLLLLSLLPPFLPPLPRVFPGLAAPPSPCSLLGTRGYHRPWRPDASCIGRQQRVPTQAHTGTQQS